MDAEDAGQTQRSSFPPHDEKDDRPIVGMTRRSSYLRVHGDFHDLTDLDGALYLKIGKPKAILVASSSDSAWRIKYPPTSSFPSAKDRP